MELLALARSQSGGPTGRDLARRRSIANLARSLAVGVHRMSFVAQISPTALDVLAQIQRGHQGKRSVKIDYFVARSFL